MSHPDLAPPVVLLVEDDPGDVLMTREGLPTTDVRVVDDGEAAIDFLRHHGRFHDAPRPDLVLLDLNLPRIDGLEVLGTIKRDATLRSIPVVVLTTSDAEDDVARSYNLHANAYVTKPVDFKAFAAILQEIHDFFLQVVRLPRS